MSQHHAGDTEIKFRRLETPEEWREAWPLILDLRPEFNETDFLAWREGLLSEGYVLWGAEFEGRIVSIAGVTILPHVSRRRDLWLHDMATLPEMRSRGFGRRLIDHLVEFAKRRGCTLVVVHSHPDDHEAHRFYEKKGGFKMHSVIYSKPVD